MNKPASNGRIRVAPLLILLLSFGSVLLALFFLAASPAGAAIFATAIPTQEDLWAYADVSKPAYTATSIPTSIPTDLPVIAPSPAPTESPSALAMEIVANAPASASAFDEQRNNVQPVNSYGGSKYILVDISEQHMYVYDGDALVYSFTASTGIGNSTRIGAFAVQTKLPNAYASTWDLWMPNWLGIYYSHGLENGIHALPILSNGMTLWAGFLGRPVSYGCVVLGTYEASLLYDWADMGTPVEIQW